MIEPTLENSLPKIMMRLTLSYSLYFNKKYKGVGHVWQGRYKSSLIDKKKEGQRKNRETEKIELTLFSFTFSPFSL